MIKETKQEYQPPKAYYVETESCYCDSCKRLIYRKDYPNPNPQDLQDRKASYEKVIRQETHEAKFYHLIGQTGENCKVDIHTCISQNCLSKAINKIGDEFDIQIRTEKIKCSETGANRPNSSEFDALRESISDIHTETPIINRLLDTIKLQNKKLEEANDDVKELTEVAKKACKEYDTLDFPFDDIKMKLIIRRNLTSDIKHVLD